MPPTASRTHHNREAVAVDDHAAEESDGDPALAAIHIGRRVPVYRKLGDSRPKQLRELIHRVLAALRTMTSRKHFQRVAQTANVDRSFRGAAAHSFPAESAALEEYERSRSPAHRRLIFEEFFWLALGLLVKRRNRNQGVERR